MSLACRQTGVSLHRGISHEQDDSVHARALDVVRGRDKFFGGLGLHPLVESQSGDDEFDHTGTSRSRKSPGSVSNAASSDCNASARPCFVTKKSTKRLIHRARAACGVVLFASSVGPASAQASTWRR